MTDELRSRIMRSVRRTNTGPELALRRLLRGMGYGYRLHRKDLPGTPDVVFPGRKRVVFCHGCFWHGHEECRSVRFPKSRVEYWGAKIARNRERDAAVEAALRAAGWDVLTVWECELRDQDAVSSRLREFLGPPRREEGPHRPA